MGTTQLTYKGPCEVLRGLFYWYKFTFITFRWRNTVHEQCSRVMITNQTFVNIVGGFEVFLMMCVKD